MAEMKDTMRGDMNNLRYADVMLGLGNHNREIMLERKALNSDMIRATF